MTLIAGQHRGWIGVDIGSHSIKLAQIERRGGRYRLAEALILRRREPWADDAVDARPLTSSDEIRAGLALGEKFFGRQAAAALSMAFCDTRGCNLPEGSEAERRALVTREMNAVFGDLSQGREFDFWPIDLPADKGPHSENVIAVSLPREWSQQIASDLTAARLVGRALDALPLALARAVELGSPGASRGPVAAVDWGYRRATLCTVIQGRPRFVRCLRQAGFAAVIQALCDNLVVSLDEAQQLITDHGLPQRHRRAGTELQGMIEEVTAEPRSQFVDELRRTLSYLHQQRSALAPERLILFGGGSALANVAEHLADRLEIPVELWQMNELESGGEDRAIPQPLLAPAIALSSLAWTAS